MISFIIPAYDEERYIGKTLAYIPDEFEKTVVCNGCSDSTYNLAKKYARVLNLSEKNVSKARNLGAMVAKNNFLVFLDADTRLSKKAYESLLRLKEKNVVGTFKVKFNKNTFLNLLIFSEDNSYLSSKFEDLIKIRYFEEFGKNKKLYEFYQEFTSGKNRYSKTHTDKTKEKRIPELQKIWNDIPNKNYSIQEQIKNELEILNEIQTNFPVNKNYAVAIELDLKYSPKIEFQNLLTGERKTFKIKSKVYNEFPINKGDILLFKKVIKKNSMTKNEEGKWIQIEDKFDLWLDVYYIIKENDKLSK